MPVHHEWYLLQGENTDRNAGESQNGYSNPIDCIITVGPGCGNPRTLDGYMLSLIPNGSRYYDSYGMLIHADGARCT